MTHPGAGIDLCIAGAGPAGLSLAAACGELGLRVAVVGPGLERAWSHNYGMWLDDAERLGMAEHLAARWERTQVVLGGVARELCRGYVRLDNSRVQADRLASCRAREVVLVEDQVEAVEHQDEHSSLHLRSGTTIDARLFVDATGHGSRFVELEPGPEPGFQVAWGELRETMPTELQSTPGVMRFMDWTPVSFDEGLPPTFLYCMPMAEGQVFVEETVLVGRPPAGDPSRWFEPLRARLHARLPSLARSGEPLAIERCVIPMGGPLPRADQRTLAFGGAASYVHPATGYMLTVALQRLDRVASALVEVHREGGPLDRASARVWRAIWTPSERRAWQLYGFGMQVLLELDHAGIEQFFTDFFELEPERWRGFLSATAPTSTLMATMLRYFASCAPAIRGRLAGHLFGQDGARLVRGLL